MQFAPDHKFKCSASYKSGRIFLRAALVIIFVLPIFAEQLPVKLYSSADGLANNSVNKIVSDSRGFLWVCTGEGLSRFDGYSFKNYTTEQGLPYPRINDFLETKDGDYLVATGKGLSVFDPFGKAYQWNLGEGKLEQNSDEPPMLKTYVTPDAEKDVKIAKSIGSLAMDKDGTVFATTSHGLFKFIKSEKDWHFERVVFGEWEKKPVEYNFVFLDSKKNLWIATTGGIYLSGNDGTIRKVNDVGGNSVFEDDRGDVWVDSGGNDVGIRIFRYQNSEFEPMPVRTYTTKDGLPLNGFSNAVAQTNDGKIFVRSDQKFYEFLAGSKEGELKFRKLENELSGSAKDKSGNIWFATNAQGIARYLPNSFYTFGEKEGMPEEHIGSIYGNGQGEVFLSVGANRIATLGDGKIITVRPRGLDTSGWNDGYLGLESRDGEFWGPSSGKGLLRFPRVANFKDLDRVDPIKTYTTADGLFINGVTALFEDSRGDIWASTPATDNSVVRWERSTGKFHQYTYESGLPKGSGAIAFGEDGAGNIWIGYYYGEIVRMKNGIFHDMTEGLRGRYSSVKRFLSDTKGRLWFSTANRGVFRLDDPNADTPNLTNISTASGLSSNITDGLAEDKFGRIYVASGRGINRIDPETGRIKIFTENDGLPAGIVSKAYADRGGTLWFTSNNSLIKYVPVVENPSTPPPVFIDSISVNGKLRPISDLGEKDVKDLELGSNERQIKISFFAISFDSGETLRYQYKLNDQDWSEANEQRTLDFGLSPGTYNFAVRAITATGVLSENTATVAFTISRPIWQRWWFVALAILIFGTVGFTVVTYRLRKIREVRVALEALNRSRAERIAELQRVRTRIATDLHDDIGSSLTQISLHSQLARQSEAEHGCAGESLDVIANVANELVDTMSDIVWAINPKKDHLKDLTQRMRRFAANVLTAKDIDLEFRVPKTDDEIPLGANVRREVFLIFKETVNNILKHSEATQATIDLSMENHFLLISFNDNGKGFDQKAVVTEDGEKDWKKFRGGNGLMNMRKRADELGGEYSIKSLPGKGTTVVLSIPLERND